MTHLLPYRTRSLLLRFCGLICWGMVVPLDAMAQSQNWTTAGIPVELTARANAVVRHDETSFKVLSRGEAIWTRRYAVTIFNEKGEAEHADLLVPYDKFTRINSVTGTIYDAAGKKLKSLKNNEIEDFGQSSDGGEITDNRFKYAKFAKKNYAYPYTVEFSYETRERNMMLYPRWTPILSYGTAVQHASLTIESPVDVPFRYKQLNGVAPPSIDGSQPDRRILRWEMKNAIALQPEAYSLPVFQFLPMVLTAPLDFEVQEYTGRFTDWQDLGKFYYELNKGRDALPVSVKDELKKKVDSAWSPDEKVRRVYEWMQSKTRYVSIQLGIGGWQTIEAMEVATKGFGDCKALSNFTVALLREVGVNAYTALVRAGANAEIEPDFPSSQFNHVIVCVPMATDTVWLECTSPLNPYGYLGDFTGNRQALLITPEGGKLVATRRYHSQDNRRLREAVVKLEASGDAKIAIATRYYGLQQENCQGTLYAKDATAQKNALIQQLGLPGAEIQQFAIGNGKETYPCIVENMNLNVHHFATLTGTRLFLRPASLMRPMNLTGGGNDRTTDFYLPPNEYSFEDSDTVRIALPKGFIPESLPPTQELESKFGNLSASLVKEGNQLVYVRNFRAHGGRYPAADFAEWVDFVKKVRRSERTQVVLVKGE
jgi:hypothetical protein